MDTENQESQSSNAKVFGIIIIIITILFGVIFFVDFSGKPDDKSAKQDGDIGQTDNNPTADNKFKEGKALFKSNCAACHNLKADGTGPALTGAKARWRAAGEYQGKTGEQWLYSWVKNWNDPVTAGYKYATDMANSRGSAMNSFPYLKDEEIEQIFLYVDSSFTSVIN